MAQRDVEADGWERSDFPILCESCLGDNPYGRMSKQGYGKECKICARPFTLFRWKPGRDARYKMTQICQTCSKQKNVCQVCILDLEFGLPVQVRDTSLNINSNDAIPRSGVNREYFAEEHDRRARAGIDYESSYGKVRPTDTIPRLQRMTPYYQRNRAHPCTFFAKGECTRGLECPFAHEMPVTGELSQQNIKDRYHGVNDPVAMKLLRRAGEIPSLEPPEDGSIRTLYIGGLDSSISEQDLRDQFSAHGEIESVKMLMEKACAFVTYSSREGAEKAAEELANKLVINGIRLKLSWGKPRPRALMPEIKGSDEARQHASVAQAMPYFNMPVLPHQDGAYYPSMDPQRMGSQEGEHQPYLQSTPPPYPRVNTISLI